MKVRAGDDSCGGVAKRCFELVPNFADLRSGERLEFSTETHRVRRSHHLLLLVGRQIHRGVRHGRRKNVSIRELDSPIDPF